VVMWRSDPPCSTIDFNNWFSVGGMTTDSGNHNLERTNDWHGVYTS
jgi:hypothetical protein